MPFGYQFREFHRVQGMVPHIPIMFLRLINSLGIGQFWNNAAEQIQVVQHLKISPCSVHRKYSQKLVADTVSGYLGNQGSRLSYHSYRFRFEPESKPGRQMHRSKESSRVILEYVRVDGPDALFRQILTPIEGVHDLFREFWRLYRWPILKWKGHGVDGEVSSG